MFLNSYNRIMLLIFYNRIMLYYFLKNRIMLLNAYSRMCMHQIMQSKSVVSCYTAAKGLNSAGTNSFFNAMIGICSHTTKFNLIFIIEFPTDMILYWNIKFRQKLTCHPLMVYSQVTKFVTFSESALHKDVNRRTIEMS